MLFTVTADKYVYCISETQNIEFSRYKKWIKMVNALIFVKRRTALIIQIILLKRMAINLRVVDRTLILRMFYLNIFLFRDVVAYF